MCMNRKTSIDRHAATPSRADHERALRQLRHRDAKGLLGLMDDYQALADELEVVDCGRATDPGPPPTSRRAA
jgi:hypothetical protein